MPLLYPLTTETHFCDPAYVEALRGFYAEAEAAIAAHLLAGRDVALVCEGDPLFYGSFMHLYVRLKDRFDVEIIPGVTGMSGCWSAAKTPMAWGDDVLSVLPGTLEHAALGPSSWHERCGGHYQARRQSRENPRGDHRGRAAARPRSMSSMARAKPRTIVPLAAKTDDHAPYFASILIPGQGRRP